MKELDRILTEWDYQRALQLYLAHGPEGYLKEYFSQGESSYRSEKLKASLMDMRSAMGELPGAEKQQSTTPKKEVQLADFYELPDALQSLILRRNAMRKERDRLFVLLPHEPNDEVRKGSAKKILDLYNEQKGLQKEIDYFYAHNRPMPEPALPQLPNNLVDLVKREAQLKANVRQARSRGQAEKQARWEAELVQVQAEIAIKSV